MKRLLTLLFCGTTIAAAQTISFGVLGGAPFTNVVNNTTVSGIASVANSANFVVGPTVQFNLPLSLRFEVDALYRPYSLNLTFPGQNAGVGSNPGYQGATTTTGVSAQQWQFPFLLQYRFKTPVVKPFVEAGIAFDHLANISAAAKNVTSGPGELIQQSDASVVLGGGVDVKIPFVRLSGELRYIHHGASFFEGISNVNQAEVLVGVHF